MSLLPQLKVKRKTFHSFESLINKTCLQFEATSFRVRGKTHLVMWTGTVFETMSTKDFLLRCTKKKECLSDGIRWKDVMKDCS